MKKVTMPRWKWLLASGLLLCLMGCPSAARLQDNFRKVHVGWMGKTASVLDAWVRAEKVDLSWVKALPDCPCTIKVSGNNCVQKDVPFDTAEYRCSYQSGTLKFYHPGAEFELRQSKPSQKQKDTGLTKIGQQCTYGRRKKGDTVAYLITEGPAAGTVDKFGAVLGGMFLHRDADVDSFCLALKCSKNTFNQCVEQYLSVRPVNKGKSCKPFDPYGPAGGKSADANKNGIPDKWEKVRYDPSVAFTTCQ